MPSKPREFAQGAKGEQSILSLLESFGLSAKKGEEKSSYFDIIINVERDYTAEVKTDIMGARTGNIALEFWNSKKNYPSGISITKSDLWFHIFKNEVWLTNTLDLKVYIQNNKPDRVFFNAGDKNANIYLYKAEKIFNGCFVRIDHLGVDDGKKKLLERLPK